MSTEEATLRELWDSIGQSVPGEPVGKVERLEDGWYLCWHTTDGDFVDMDPIGDDAQEAAATLHAIVWGGPGWDVTMDDIIQAERLLEQVPSLSEMVDW